MLAVPLRDGDYHRNETRRANAGSSRDGADEAKGQARFTVAAAWKIADTQAKVLGQNEPTATAVL